MGPFRVHFKSLLPFIFFGFVEIKNHGKIMLDLCQGSSRVERAFNMDWRGDSITYTNKGSFFRSWEKNNRLTHGIVTY